MNENLTPQIVAALLQDGTVKMTGEEIAAAIADAIGALDKQYRFRGVATPGLAPGKIFEPTLYVAVASATYGPFSNQSVDKGQIVFFTSDDGAYWSDVVAYCGGDGCPEPGPDPALSEYLTFEAKEPAVVKFYRSAYGESYGDFKVEASTDGGQTWNEVTATADGAVVASLAAGEKVLLRGTNERYGYYDEDQGESRNLAQFRADGQCYVYGNIMSLMGGAEFSELREVPECGFARFFPTGKSGAAWLLSKEGKKLLLPATTLSVMCYSSMFRGCTSLTAAPELPATTLAAACYNSMFYGCSSLTAAPELPATTLAEGCYGAMFNGCSSLSEAPELPATTLAEGCYSAMFNGCENLTEAPELPATTLAEGCYGAMFNGCSSLTEAPELPATTLAEGCYGDMFNGCENLVQVTCLATDISATNATAAWLYGVAAIGTFRKAAGVNWPTGINGIPEGWTVIEA